MHDKGPPNQAQAALWNDTAGWVWTDLHGTLDDLFEPFAALLAEAAVAAGGKRILDVGCGAGGTTLAVARTLGPESRCCGIDISAPLIATAQARANAAGATNVTFIKADAQTHDFGAGRFDTVISRFGVMFFDEPEMAFANLRRATRAGTLAFLAWRSRDENPFMTAAERAASPIVKELGMPGNDGPGQFAFASDARVNGILQASGWTSIEIRPVDIACTLPLAKLVDYVTRMGPYGRVRDALDGTVRAKADSAVIAAFDPYVAGNDVRIATACWLVTAAA
jgi:SAM-dependent methyltransferase